jgi:hypothetical protein
MPVSFSAPTPITIPDFFKKSGAIFIFLWKIMEYYSMRNVGSQFRKNQVMVLKIFPRNWERRGEKLSFKAFFSPFLLREGGWGVRF